MRDYKNGQRGRLHRRGKAENYCFRRKRGIIQSHTAVVIFFNQRLGRVYGGCYNAKRKAVIAAIIKTNSPRLMMANLARFSGA